MKIEKTGLRSDEEKRKGLKAQKDRDFLISNS